LIIFSVIHRNWWRSPFFVNFFPLFLFLVFLFAIVQVKFRHFSKLFVLIFSVFTFWICMDEDCYHFNLSFNLFQLNHHHDFFEIYLSQFFYTIFMKLFGLRGCDEQKSKLDCERQ
jgi:hypothetical protein